jgi:hypothetical protein
LQLTVRADGVKHGEPPKIKIPLGY